MVTRYEPDNAEAYRKLMALLRERHGATIFSEDGSTVDEQVAGLLAGRRIATAESCTAGLLAARLTDRPGSWLAACLENNLRDSGRALRLARQVCAGGSTDNSRHLDILAAAYAEIGRFDEAVHTIP